MAHVDYPKLDLTQDTNAADYIVALYRELGWDQKSELDPKRIVMNPEQWKDIAGALNQTAEGRTAGFLWVNSGPSADEKVPYGKIEIEDGAFNRGDPGLSGADKAAIDETVSSSFVVEGTVVYLEADWNETNEFLLQEAYDVRNTTPQAFLESLHERVADAWVDSVDLATAMKYNDKAMQDITVDNPPAGKKPTRLNFCAHYSFT